MTRARLNVLTVVMAVVPSDSFDDHGTGKIATRSSQRLAAELGPVGKNNVRELGPVDAAARVGDGRSEFAQDLLVRGLALFDQSVGQRIGVEDGEAHFAEHGGDGALPAGNSARESESEHFFFRLPRDGARLRPGKLG